MDNASSEPVWENLRRREELRKAETAAGGRKKYVSPLELFRMQLDADAAGEASTSTAVAEEEEIGSGQEDGHDSAVRDIDPDTPSVVPPPSPDDYVGARMPEGQASNDQSMVFSKESWLKCMFPFKQCRKAMKSASRSLGLVDMSTTSKDTFFRNPLYNKNKLKARNNKSQGQVDESAVSASNKSKTKMNKNRSVERSDGSKKISAAVSCPGSERRKGGNESARYQGDDEAELERSDGESMGEPDLAVLLEYYRRPVTFPFGRPQSQSSSPVVKQKSCRSVGALRRALLRTRHPPEARRATVSASPDPSKLHERRRPETPDFGGHGNDKRDVVVVSHARGKGGRAKATRSPMIPEGFVRRRGRGDAVSVAAADQDKSDRSKSSAGGRNSRGIENSGDTGFTAFVRFQGFDVYANQRGSAPAESSNLESQCSSASGSRNTSRNNSRNSTHSKNSDRYYQRK